MGSLLKKIVPPESRGIISHLIKQLSFDLKHFINSFGSFDISIFHEYINSPGGGGHQFLRALQEEFKRRNYKIENNTLSAATGICLFNSFNFDFNRLKKYQRDDCYMVHRLDGPIQRYRGWDNGIDLEIWKLNQEIAQATIFQSEYSYNAYIEMGMQFTNPSIIMNSTNPIIFHSNDRIPFNPQRKIKLISSSWSDNPNKGSVVYQWLDSHLDWNKYEYTFVGRSPVPFLNIQSIPPVNSYRLAALLRNHDIFITASINDPCSNSLIEALACGLPAIYLNSGGHPEIVGEAGLSFQEQNQIPTLLAQLVDEYEYRQKLISIPSISDTASAYLQVMGLISQKE
jgi:glycosyltransferase involved in cell wall biosynthesis